MAKNYVQIAETYIDDVLTGKIPNCEWVIKACQRSRDDREKFVGPESPYIFNAAKANKACSFIEKLKTIEDSIGTRGGEFISLQPFQCWMLVQLFGWVIADDGSRGHHVGTRRYRRAVYFSGRGNGKSCLASAVALFTTFCEGVTGAEGVCAASQEKQAGIVLNVARESIKESPLCDVLGLTVSEHDIRQKRTKSRLWSLPAKATSAEGLKSSFASLDEFFLQRARDLYETLGTGCQKRDGSLFLLCSTAGDDTSGIAWELVEFCRRVLNGEAEDDTMFAALYGTDVADDWRGGPDVWRKANPGWAVTVSPRAMAEACKRAEQMPGERQNFRIKNLCDWLAANGGDQAFFDPAQVQACYNAALKEADYTGNDCVMGLDCASKLDLTSAYKIYMRRDANQRPHYYAFGLNFYPKKAIRECGVAAMAGFVARGEVYPSGDSTTDYSDILTYLNEQIRTNKVRDILFDPAQATMLVQESEKFAMRKDLFVECRQLAVNLTPGIRELQEAVADGRFHTNDSCLLWTMRNLRCANRGMNFLQPIRLDRDHKIDSVVSVIMAMRSTALAPIGETRHVEKYNGLYQRAADLRAQGKPINCCL